MTIEINKGSISLNNIAVNLKQSPTKLYQEALGDSYRTVALDYGITILIFDAIGIRAWVRDNIVYELEIQLKEDADHDPKSPRNGFRGAIYLYGEKLLTPYFVKDILAQHTVKTERDDDSFRYGLNILKAHPDQGSAFSLWCDDNFLRVTAIRFS